MAGPADALPLGAGRGRLLGNLLGLGLLRQAQLQDVVDLGEEGQEELRVGLLHRLLELSGGLQLMERVRGLAGRQGLLKHPRPGVRGPVC